MERSSCCLPVAILLLTAQALCTSSAAAGDWPAFRGPDGTGTAPGETPPTEWGPNRNIRWRIPLPGAGASAPVVVGNRIYLTAATGYGVSPQDPGTMPELKRHVLCLDRDTGKEIWQTSFDPELPEEEYARRMHWHGFASSTPAADDSGVYAFFGRSGVVALDSAGTVRWTAPVGDKVHGWGSAASVLLHGDLVIVNGCVESESLHAFRKSDGSEAWRLGGLKESWATPVTRPGPDGKPVVLLPMFGRVAAVDPGTGGLMREWEGISYYMAPSPAVWENTVFVTGGREYISFAFNPSKPGTDVLWRAKVGSNVPSPVAANGLFFGIHDREGRAYCLDAATGDVRFDEKLPGRNAEFYPSAVAADGKVYFTDRAGTTTVIAAKPALEVLARNELDRDAGAFNATPVLHANEILIRSDRYLYCIGNP